MRIEKYKQTRFWAVYDNAGVLICVCVYRKGAEEVKRRLGRRKGIPNREAGTQADRAASEAGRGKDKAI